MRWVRNAGEDGDKHPILLINISRQSLLLPKTLNSATFGIGKVFVPHNRQFRPGAFHSLFPSQSAETSKS
jgi:hypothetical protein